MTEPVTPVAPTAAPAAVPNRAGPTFSADIYAWFSWESAVVPEVGALANTAYTNAVAANERAVTATTKANEASASASTANEKAGIATTKAGEASDSAGVAVQAAIDAGALLDQFDDRYMGVKASDPTLDNDGNPLVAGAIYINSMSGYLRAYTGTGWVQGISVIAGVESLNGLQGVLSIKTINGVALIGAGNINTATPDLYAFIAAQG